MFFEISRKNGQKMWADGHCENLLRLGRDGEDQDFLYQKNSCLIYRELISSWNCRKQTNIIKSSNLVWIFHSVFLYTSFAISTCVEFLRHEMKHVPFTELVRHRIIVMHPSLERFDSFFSSFEISNIHQLLEIILKRDKHKMEGEWGGSGTIFEPISVVRWLKNSGRRKGCSESLYFSVGRFK